MARRRSRSRSRRLSVTVHRPVTISRPLVRSELARRPLVAARFVLPRRIVRARLIIPARQPMRRSRNIPASIFMPVERSSYVARRKLSCRELADRPSGRPRFSAGIGARQWAISRLQRERRCK